MTVTQEGIASRVEAVCSRYPQAESNLIEVLHDIAAEFHYLPADALKQAGEHLGVPLAKVYAVATFYKGFSLEPRGEKVIRVCKGTACHVRGAERNVDEVRELLGIGPGETTKDMKFTLEVVNCVGACAMAPVVVVNEKYYRDATAATVREIVGADNVKASDLASKGGEG